MASNHTEHFSLNQWLPDDQVKRTDFNGDNAKIDAALNDLSDGLAAAQAEKADQSALDTLAVEVAKKATTAALEAVWAAVPKIAVGTYTGDGSAARVIPLSFTPKAVFVITQQSRLFIRESAFYYTYGGLAVTGSPVWDCRDQPTVSVVSGGFQVEYRSLDDGRDNTLSNAEDVIYNYLAIG